MRINEDLMVFVLETICLKKIEDGVYVINLHKYANVAHIGMLYFVTKVKLFISLVFMLNMFLRKLKNLSEIKT